MNTKGFSKELINMVIEFEIKRRLTQVKDVAWEKKYSTYQWTHEIKKELAVLGTQLGNEICTSGFGKLYNSEWLYDLTWYKNNLKNQLKTVALAVEIEWGRELKHIQYDFEKLLCSNAELKLMICQAKPRQIQEFKEYFKSAVRSYSLSQKGEKYLIAILDDYGNGDFLYDLITKN